MNNTILIVDDTEENIDVLVDLLCEDYDLLVALDGERGLDLAKTHKPDLILLDVMMPNMSGYKVIAELKNDTSTIHIPVIFLTALSDADDEAKGINLGAVDFIRKPFNPLIVQSRIRNNIFYKNYQNALEKKVAERTEKVEKTKEVIIKSMGMFAEYRDPETGAHIKRTQNYLMAMAKHLKAHGHYLEYFTSDTIKSLYKSAPLHDIGKISIPDSILLKPGKLTSEEFEIMKTHAIKGKEAIERIMKDLPDEEFLNNALEIAYTHHEKWDGSGYPNGLKGEAIPISGRIMAVVDVYDALISRRVYKPAFSHEEAREIIIEGKGKHFDPLMVETFLAIEEEFISIAKTYTDENPIDH